VAQEIPEAVFKDERGKLQLDSTALIAHLFRRLSDVRHDVSGVRHDVNDVRHDVSDLRHDTNLRLQALEDKRRGKDDDAAHVLQETKASRNRMHRQEGSNGSLRTRSNG